MKHNTSIIHNNKLIIINGDNFEPREILEERAHITLHILHNNKDIDIEIAIVKARMKINEKYLQCVYL